MFGYSSLSHSGCNSCLFFGNALGNSMNRHKLSFPAVWVVEVVLRRMSATWRALDNLLWMSVKWNLKITHCQWSFLVSSIGGRWHITPQNKRKSSQIVRVSCSVFTTWKTLDECCESHSIQESEYGCCEILYIYMMCLKKQQKYLRIVIFNFGKSRKEEILT